MVSIHDMDQTSKEVTTSQGIMINAQANATTITNDIFSWAPTFEIALKYLERQLQVFQSQDLSFSLKKSLFFPSQIEFIGPDVCKYGNRPAQSKNNLLKTWPKFKVCPDVHSFVGFIMFYAPYIPDAKLRLSKLREHTKMPHEASGVHLVTAEHYAEQNNML